MRFQTSSAMSCNAATALALIGERPWNSPRRVGGDELGTLPVKHGSPGLAWGRFTR
jgi:hypothetical protein